MAAPDALRVHAGPDGAFVVESDRGVAWRFAPDGDRWSVHGLPDRPAATLRRARRGRPGFVLEVAGDELARSATPWGMERVPALRDVLLADGRAFRMMPGLDASPTVRVLGWEGFGAYLSAQRDASAWQLVTEPSGHALRNIDDLSVMVAAELAEIERTRGATYVGSG